MMTMDGKMRILILEDRASDAEVVKFCLTEAGFIFAEKCVTNGKEFLEALHKFQPDLILSDYDLPDYNGALALRDDPKIISPGSLYPDHGCAGRKRNTDG
ncbi:MAG: response regulator [Deltaproteobacteria bacterium]|nr:response regulator [Deltaproteobacteria bacterium]